MQERKIQKIRDERVPSSWVALKRQTKEFLLLGVTVLREMSLKEEEEEHRIRAEEGIGNLTRFGRNWD